MDHETATGIRAVERYILDEMTAEESAAFEEHFFECTECATEVKAATGFLANARARFEMQRDAKSADGSRSAEPAASWFWWRWQLNWLAPALVLVFAFLALYPWLVTVPRLRRQPAATEVAEVFQPVLLRTQTRGESSPTIHATAGSSVVLTLNIESDRDYPGYLVEILNASGATVSKIDAPPGPTVNLRLPGTMLGRGTYTIIVRGGKDGYQEIGRYKFEVDPR